MMINKTRILKYAAQLKPDGPVHIFTRPSGRDEYQCICSARYYRRGELVTLWQLWEYEKNRDYYSSSYYSLSYCRRCRTKALNRGWITT